MLTFMYQKFTGLKFIYLSTSKNKVGLFMPLTVFICAECTKFSVYNLVSITRPMKGATCL